MHEFYRDSHEQAKSIKDNGNIIRYLAKYKIDLSEPSELKNDDIIYNL